jgi:hypothetical protein
MITKRERLEAMAREWHQYAESHSGVRAETFSHCSKVLRDALAGAPVPHTTLMAEPRLPLCGCCLLPQADCADKKPGTCFGLKPEPQGAPPKREIET